MAGPIHTFPASEGEGRVGVARREARTARRAVPGGESPPSTALRAATSPSEEGEGSKVRPAKRTDLAKGRARELRKRQTEAEKRLWYFVHRKQLDGLRFRRQAPIGNFVVDFLCPALRLAVEVDGVEAGKDAARTAWLESQGITVIRFWNNEVMDNIEGVLTAIRMEAEALRAERTAPAPASGKGKDDGGHSRSLPLCRGGGQGGGGAPAGAHGPQGRSRRRVTPIDRASRGHFPL